MVDYEYPTKYAKSITSPPILRRLDQNHFSRIFLYSLAQ